MKRFMVLLLVMMTLPSLTWCSALSGCPKGPKFPEATHCPFGPYPRCADYKYQRNERCDYHRNRGDYNWKKKGKHPVLKQGRQQLAGKGLKQPSRRAKLDKQHLKLAAQGN